MGVMRPQEIVHEKKTGMVIDEWEIDLNVLKSDLGEKVSESMKLAIFVGMTPRDNQDMIYQGMGSAKLGYKMARDRVRSLVEHRANMAKPAPMDVGIWESGIMAQMSESGVVVTTFQWVETLRKIVKWTMLGMRVFA